MDLSVLKIVLQVVLAVASVLVVMFILLHKGKGGGLSDMFGGGVSQSASASGVAERNLDIITVITGIIWAASAVGLGIVARFM